MNPNIKPNNPNQNKMYTVGQILKARRTELNLELKQASVDTKIKEEYLEKIENNNFQEFDTEIFVSGFIKIYASYLDLDVNKVLALYRRDNKTINLTDKKIKSPPTLAKLKEKAMDLATPKNFIYFTILSLLVGVFTYLGYQYYIFNEPPVLSLKSPTTTEVDVETNEFKIQGSVSDTSEILINEESINTNIDGSFEETVSLQEGANIIEVKAVKESNNNAVTSEIITINYEKPKEVAVQGESDETSEEEVIEVNLEKELTVSIGDAEAWTFIAVDGIQERAEILPAEFTETYTATESIEITSGRPTVTKVTIEGEEQELIIDTESGTASLNCEINQDNGDITCND